MAEIVRDNTTGEEVAAVYINRIEEELYNFFSGLVSPDVANDHAKLAEEIRKASDNRFSAALMHIRAKVFPDRDMLKSVSGWHWVPGSTGLKVEDKAYDPDIIAPILDYYIYLCNVYDKTVTQHGFCKLIGVSDGVISSWGNPDNGDRVSDKRKAIYKKLRGENENSLTGMLTTGKRNPVGLLGVLNHYHGWNMPGVSREIGRRTARALDQLPQFGNVHNALTDGSRAQDVQDATQPA